MSTVTHRPVSGAQLRAEHAHQQRLPFEEVARRIWVGPWFADQPKRILFLGESYFGEWAGDIECEDTYIPAWIARKVVDPLHERMEQVLAPGEPRGSLYNRVAFTNMLIGSVGPKQSDRPKQQQMRDAQPRLQNLIAEHRIDGVLIMGKSSTGPAAEPVCRKAGIRYRAIRHPSGVNNQRAASGRCTDDEISDAWRYLTST